MMLRGIAEMRILFPFTNAEDSGRVKNRVEKEQRTRIGLGLMGLKRVDFRSKVLFLGTKQPVHFCFV